MSEKRERLYTPAVSQFIALNQADLAMYDAQVAQLLDESSTPEDRLAAEELIDEELQQTSLAERLGKGLISYIPAYSDKGPMLALDAKDKKVFSLFNNVASASLRQYSVFHQVGSYQDSGYTAWELNSDQLPSPHTLMKHVLAAFVVTAQTE